MMFHKLDSGETRLRGLVQVEATAIAKFTE
jgi:hypothetical protein